MAVAPAAICDPAAHAAEPPSVTKVCAVWPGRIACAALSTAVSNGSYPVAAAARRPVEGPTK
jgi:hypothetical protein